MDRYDFWYSHYSGTPYARQRHPEHGIMCPSAEAALMTRTLIAFVTATVTPCMMLQ